MFANEDLPERVEYSSNLHGEHAGICNKHRRHPHSTHSARDDFWFGQMNDKYEGSVHFV